jgi:hypothetical protein
LTGLIVISLIAAIVIVLMGRHREIHGSTPGERAERERRARAFQVELQYGALNPAMICPHCQCKGSVRVKRVQEKAGVSGGKATAALLTGGLSLLAH